MCDETAQSMHRKVLDYMHNRPYELAAVDLLASLESCTSSISLQKP